MRAASCTQERAKNVPMLSSCRRGILYSSQLQRFQFSAPHKLFHFLHGGETLASMPNLLKCHLFVTDLLRHGESSQVSPNACGQTQCKGGGGNKNITDTHTHTHIHTKTYRWTALVWQHVSSTKSLPMWFSTHGAHDITVDVTVTL